MGPPGLLSLYQPVDLMDFVVATNHWNQISPKMKRFVEDKVQIYSNPHLEAWPLLEKAGVEVNRLSSEDIDQFQAIAVPIWYKWANKDKDAARLFKLQLDIMKNPSFGYVTPEMLEGQKLDL